MVGDRVPPAPQWRRQCMLLGFDLGMALQLRANQGGDGMGRQRGARRPHQGPRPRALPGCAHPQGPD